MFGMGIVMKHGLHVLGYCQMIMCDKEKLEAFQLLFMSSYI